MKRNVVLFAILTTMIVAIASVEAVEIGNILGVITNVQVLPAQSLFGAPNITVVYFDDGRVVTFVGILTGVSFQIGKEHLIEYNKHDWSILKVTIKPSLPELPGR